MLNFFKKKLCLFFREEAPVGLSALGLRKNRVLTSNIDMFSCFFLNNNFKIR